MARRKSHRRPRRNPTDEAKAAVKGVKAAIKKNEAVLAKIEKKLKAAPLPAGHAGDFKAGGARAKTKRAAEAKAMEKYLAKAARNGRALERGIAAERGGRGSARARARRKSGLKVGGATKRRVAAAHDGSVLAAKIRIGDRVMVVRGTAPGEKRLGPPKIVYSANVGGVRYNPSRPQRRRHSSKPRGHRAGCGCVVCHRPRHNPTPPRSARSGRFLKRGR